MNVLESRLLLYVEREGLLRTCARRLQSVSLTSAYHIYLAMQEARQLSQPPSAIRSECSEPSRLNSGPLVATRLVWLPFGLFMMMLRIVIRLCSGVSIVNVSE